MRNAKGMWIFAAILLLLDVYVFQALRVITLNTNNKTKLVIYSIYWLVTILSLTIFLLLPQFMLDPKYKQKISYAFSIVVGLTFFKIFIALFLAVDDIRRLVQWISAFFVTNKEKSIDNNISRSAFLSWLGIGVGGTLFSTLLLGFTNKYNYKVKNIKLQFPNLPTAFKGIKVVQLSDIHSGSFDNKAAVEKGIAKVMELKPDLILFTGDLVNNIATEMEEYKDSFAKLKAPLGVFSVLGNHDYGDYYPWPDRNEAHLLKEKEAKAAYAATLEEANIDPVIKKGLVRHFRLYAPEQQKHLNDLKQLQANMGWRLLMNENVVLEKDNDKIALIGIENWGARGNFPKYGRLDIAHKGTENLPFKILMSHDPSHWDAQITESYKDIDLTLSGHTHGMQFGVEIPWLRWSPIQHIYKQWAGVYEKGTQKLYVNRGFGFLGYPGRVGIMPEITLFELS